MTPPRLLSQESMIGPTSLAPPKGHDLKGHRSGHNPGFRSRMCMKGEKKGCVFHREKYDTTGLHSLPIVLITL